VANSAGKVDQHGVSSGVKVPTKTSDLASSFYLLKFVCIVLYCFYLFIYFVFIVFLYLLYFCILYFSGCIYCFGIPVPQIIVFLCLNVRFLIMGTLNVKIQNAQKPFCGPRNTKTWISEIATTDT
jgi:hypothetical protein